MICATGQNRLSKILIYGAMTAILCSLFLFSPKPPEDYCGKYIDLGANAGFPLNCDSYNYVETTQNPRKLFDKESVRQARPGYVILASALGWLISPIPYFFPLTRIAAQDELLASSFYWSFIILNFFTLLLSLLLFDRIVDFLTGKTFPQFLKYILAIFLVSNVVIKTSFWSAHQQMLTLFSPLLCVYLTLKIALAEEFDFKKVCLISLLGGFLLLTYGNFLILLPSILLAITVQLVRSGKFSRSRAFKFFVSAILLFAFPILTWSAVLLIVNGSVYNHEINAYRQFIWIFDKLIVSYKDFYEQFVSFTTIYGTSIYRTVLIFLIGFFTIKIINSLHRFKKKQADNPPDYLLMRNISAVIFMLYFFFFWLMGYYSERLTFTLVPIVLCLIALELSILINRGKALTVKIVYVLLIFSALFWVYQGVTAYEPYKDLTGTKTGDFLQTYI